MHVLRCHSNHIIRRGDDKYYCPVMVMERVVACGVSNLMIKLTVLADGNNSMDLVVVSRCLCLVSSFLGKVIWMELVPWD